MIPGRRSHDTRPMSPAAPSERRPSASEELSRPSIQTLTHPGSDGASGRGDSSSHFVGDAVSRRLGFLGVGDPKSSSTTSFLPPRSHSRVDSNSIRDVPSNMSSSTLVSVSKQHVSPSKVSIDPFLRSILVPRGAGGRLSVTHSTIVDCPTLSDTLVVRPMMCLRPSLRDPINSTDIPWLLTELDGPDVRFETRFTRNASFGNFCPLEPDALHNRDFLFHQPTPKCVEYEL